MYLIYYDVKYSWNYWLNKHMFKKTILIIFLFNFLLINRKKRKSSKKNQFISSSSNLESNYLILNNIYDDKYSSASA